MQGPAEADGNIRVRLNGVGVYDPTRLAGADPDPYSSRMVPDDNALNSPRADASAAFRATLDLFQTGVEVMPWHRARRINSVMMLCGHYDNSGEFAVRVGLPGKSGVGGGLIAVSPGKFGIAVVSPPLDDAGNSVRAQKAIADISNALGGNPYAAK